MTAPEEKTVYVRIEGRVQGVGFRQWVYREAERLHLSGWVRNTRPGDVEAAFAGPWKSIQEMLAYCEKGPSLARVERITLLPKEQAVTLPRIEEKTFEILPTS